MNIIEPDFNDFDEAVVKLSTYSGDPDEYVIYEQNKKGVYYPSFIRYGELVLDVGKKVQIEVASNGYIVKQGNNTHIFENKWDLEGSIHSLTRKTIEKERKLTEEEVEELITMTLKVNTHFAAQSKK